MKIVCSRLARTVEELSDIAFEIKYVPGKSNSAADALSRIGLPVPVDGQHLEYSLPDGLLVDGPLVAGSGNSLFTSLLRSLS